MANKTDKTVFKIGLESVSKIGHPNRHVQSVETAIENGTSFITALNGLIAKASLHITDENSAVLHRFADEARYSDPVSVDQSSAVESQILEQATSVATLLESGESCPNSAFEEMSKLLAYRNTLCKKGK